MAECPRCSEQIERADLFCPHCGTDLRVRGARPGDVVLVLDRGLYQFGKYVLALLALFLVIGAYFFGFDLKTLVKEMGDARAELDSASDQIKIATESTDIRLVKLSKNIAEADLQVADLKSKLADAETQLMHIRRARTQAEVALANINSLTGEELARTLAAADSAAGIDPEDDPKPVSHHGSEKLFDNGTTLSYAFLDNPTDLEREAVRQGIAAWQPFVNLKFEEVQNPATAIIRIGFRRNSGVWSFLGRDAVGIGQNEPTMNFGWDISQPEQHNTVLNVIGHALGFVNEHQNPRNGIVWDEQAVIGHFSSPPNNWSQDLIHLNILRKVPLQSYPCSRSLDINSIMMNAFPAGLTLSGEAIAPNTALSESDKACAREMYPA